MSHHHHHDHHQETNGELSFEEKLDKILTHWLKHNEDHAATYQSWALKARDNGMDKAADHLDAAARMTLEINTQFQAAGDAIK
jgi:hypothetical protein